MSKENIIVYGITRSATTLLTHLIRLGLNSPNRSEAFQPAPDFQKFSHEEFLRERRYFIDLEIDKYNFQSGSDDILVLNMHANFLNDFSESQLERWISVLKNRDFHIIELRRQNFRELVFSNYIASETGEFINYSRIPKKFIAKREKLKSFIKLLLTLQNKIDKGLWGIPVNQKVTMEEFLRDGKFTINGKDFFIDDIPIGYLKSNIAPKKSDCIENYEEALEMYNELYQELTDDKFYI